jgi:hypothetical protein
LEFLFLVAPIQSAQSEPLTSYNPHNLPSLGGTAPQPFANNQQSPRKNKGRSTQFSQFCMLGLLSLITGLIEENASRFSGQT